MALMATEKHGACCICGTEGKLSFEHVPPRSAFNDHRVFEADIEKLMEGKWAPGARPTEGNWKQRGAGRHSLCIKCNNDTGSWYGESYVQVVKQAMLLLYRSGGNLSLAYPYGMFPLRFLKQVVTMFFSACGPGLQDKNPDLVRFVLNRDVRQLPPKFQFFAYLHHPESAAIRQSGLTGMVKGQNKQHVFSEIAFPPFGLIMNVDGHPPVDHRLCNIANLSEYPYRAWDIVYLKLPVLHVTTVLPGDFRTVDEVNTDIAENRKVGDLLLNAPMSA
jgi:hypothetical protein